jgi:predicted homoserine dehydrogenase-like protein
MELVRKLRERDTEGRPVRVGIVGCGQMGSGVAHVVMRTPGMKVSAMADIDVGRAHGTFRDLGVPESAICQVGTIGEGEDALRRGKSVVTEDALLLPRLESVDVNVEATGGPDIGARVAWESIQQRRAVVMLNVETDVTVGYLLNREARRAGCVYTVASGDEPGVCKMLHEQAIMMGFEVVCLGKGKNNPIDYAATGESCAVEAALKGMNPKVLASFKDGTKTMVEMAAVANATGLVPDTPGMHGPAVELEDLVRTFIPRADGGIFSGSGRVDYSTGAIAPGVFAIVRSDDPRIRKDMKFITRAEGPYYLLFRPYHLCDIETPQSIAEAVLMKERTATADFLCAEVVGVAKRDLATGARVEGLGGADILGRIQTVEMARRLGAVPLGIVPGGQVLAPIRRGEVLTGANFAPDTTTFVYELRRRQDALTAPKVEVAVAL